MRRRVWIAVPAIAAALAGCGQSATTHSPTLSQLPLVRGASIATRVRQCDAGANAFCAIELVVVDDRAASSAALVAGERQQLHRLGWSVTSPDNGQEHAAESPGHRLRITYATAMGDLEGIDLAWIKRPRPIALTLAHTMFDGTPAMSVLLEAGPG